jgi:hypothetical protein
VLVAIPDRVCLRQRRGRNVIGMRLELVVQRVLVDARDVLRQS